MKIIVGTIVIFAFMVVASLGFFESEWPNALFWLLVLISLNLALYPLYATDKLTPKPQDDSNIQ
jgi:hypothetical protein